MKDYVRNRKERKEYIHQIGLLLAGVGVSKAKHKDFRLPQPYPDCSTSEAEQDII